MSRNTLSKTVAEKSVGAWQPATSLRSRGQRKYLTRAERRSLALAAEQLEPKEALLVLLLLWSGARISEVLRLRPNDIDLSEGVVAFRTLKRRRPHVREVPLPRELLLRLDQIFDITATQADLDRGRKHLFTCCRCTAWRLVKRLCTRANIFGPAATLKGLRHGFGVGTLQAGVPLTLVQRWLGHSRLTTTAIYAQVVGPEEKAFAQRFWELE